VKIEPSNPEHPQAQPDAWSRYRKYVASIPAPTIAIVQDTDKPKTIGSFWGEVNANVHRALGCVGTITDGAIRDVDEMTNAGFKSLARRLCVGHAHAFPVEWDCEVEVFGTTVKPGQLIHADKHGFLVIPEEDQDKLLEAAEFMDANECETLISAAREHTGKSKDQILKELDDAGKRFNENALRKFQKGGEWS
jgi:regulator of RNase E activity RraA